VASATYRLQNARETLLLRRECRPAFQKSEELPQPTHALTVPVSTVNCSSPRRHSRYNDPVARGMGHQRQRQPQVHGPAPHQRGEARALLQLIEEPTANK